MWISGFNLGEEDCKERQIEVLYILQREPTESIPSQKKCFTWALSSSKNSILLWVWQHSLDHPNYQHLKILFPKLFMNKKRSLFKCESCELSNNHRTSFSSQPYKASLPFNLINNVWGPSRTTIITSKQTMVCKFYRWPH